MRTLLLCSVLTLTACAVTTMPVDLPTLIRHVHTINGQLIDANRRLCATVVPTLTDPQAKAAALAECTGTATAAMIHNALDPSVTALAPVPVPGLIK